MGAFFGTNRCEAWEAWSSRWCQAWSCITEVKTSCKILSLPNQQKPVQLPTRQFVKFEEIDINFLNPVRGKPDRKCKHTPRSQIDTKYRLNSDNWRLWSKLCIILHFMKVLPKISLKSRWVFTHHSDQSGSCLKIYLLFSKQLVELAEKINVFQYG